jgi:FkbM family methyltransferase
MNQAEFVLSLINYQGFFVDIGAFDGISHSNTKLLEDNGWAGVCFEPHPKSFQLLEKNRKKSFCFNFALSNESVAFAQFIQVDGYAEEISCLVKDTPQEHLDRIEYDLRGGNKTIIEVPVKKFSDVIKVPTIEYISIDAETQEFNILQGIDFDKHYIKLISFEKNNYDTNDCGKFLESKGFKFINQIAADHFYVKE